MVIIFAKLSAKLKHFTILTGRALLLVANERIEPTIPSRMRVEKKATVR